MMTPTVPAFASCTACSDRVVEEYRGGGFDFVKSVCCDEDGSYLEGVSGLAAFRELAAKKLEECITGSTMRTEEAGGGGKERGENRAMRLCVGFRRRNFSPSDTARPRPSTTTSDGGYGGGSNTEGCRQRRTTAGEAMGAVTCYSSPLNSQTGKQIKLVK